MRADLDRNFEESYYAWVHRLYEMLLEAGSVEKADKQVVTILLNQIPPLLEEIERRRPAP